MGKEHSTYFYDRHGQPTNEGSGTAVIRVHSVEHDVYGNPSFTASILDLAGAKEALPLMRRQIHHKEALAIASAIRDHERSK